MAYLATKANPKVSVGALVGSRFAMQNILGVEYALKGAARCDVVHEPWSINTKTFWFRGPNPTEIQLLYSATQALVEAGIGEFWEDFYFAGKTL